MNIPAKDWSQSGRGRRHPVTAWTYSTGSNPTALDVDLESGDVAIVTADEHLHLLAPDGLRRREPLPDCVGPAMDWADTGVGGVIQLGPRRAGWVTRHGEVQWVVDCHNDILDVATSPFGNAIAISFSDRQNVVLDSNQQPIGEFTSIRPLKYLRLVPRRPVIIGSADTGVLSSHTIAGDDRWSQQIWTNVGGLDINGNGRTALLAAYNHGVQRFNNRGRSLGFYDIGGTVHIASISYIGTIIATATMEERFVLIDRDGTILWQAELPEPVSVIRCGPFGEHVVLGFSSGLIQCLKWPPWSTNRPAPPTEPHD